MLCLLRERVFDQRKQNILSPFSPDSHLCPTNFPPWLLQLPRLWTAPGSASAPKLIPTTARSLVWNDRLSSSVREPQKKPKGPAVRTTSAATAVASTSNSAAPAMSLSGSQRHSSVEMEEVEDEDAYAPRAGPRDSRRILELADGSDDDNDNLPDVIPTPSDADITVIDDSDDDDTAGREGDWEDEVAPETAEEELARLSQDWTAPIYVFFKENVKIETVKGRRCHIFHCAATNCLGTNGRSVRRYLDKKDAKSTGNLHKHAERCWGAATVKAANATSNATSAREALANAKTLDASITASFKRAAKATVTYSHRQHTTAKARAEFVRWVCKSKRPFQVVNDRAFKSLMKTGQPGYTIPSAETLSRDVKKFDTKKKVAAAGEDPIDALARELDDAMGTLLDDDQPEDGDEDDEDGLGDVRAGMSAAEIAELEESLGPVRALLTKLCAFSNAVRRSSTLLLPAWIAMLKKLALRVRNMPGDVPTRWNSTFDMLEFAITYRTAIDAMTAECSLSLRKYKLDDKEWLIAIKLRDTLKPNVIASSDDANIFDNLPVLAAPTTESDTKDELDAYLEEKTEKKVKDLCRWWYEQRATYPRLYRMALDYHTIPATSVDVERVFSEGRIVLSHLRNHLSVQSTRALMCVGVWSKLGYVKGSDIKKVVSQTPPLKDSEIEASLASDWDAILV
ncbi:hypothetical protein D9619_008796 [Psilocybe cf. subviscida]|uniref:HAT C-terminal dimerisation domain-containing protein n=1 Tax=Psilocybe cf. subviscida TaxID=2480587 RepID=A0A8H5F0V9_9AGAR|nr:hypothetical protein D9619_008796 [Psilocybe cf. subviscida]